MRENNKQREQLSALMDGELSQQELRELLDKMEQQPELRQQWSDHHTVRHTLFEQRGEMSAFDSSMADRVAAAIIDEPTVLAPARSKQGNRIKPWIPLALAASLATVTFMVMQPQIQQQMEPVAQNSIQTEWVEIDGEWVERWVNPLDQQARMRSYLVRHDENRSSARERASLVSTAPTLSQQKPRIAKRIVGWQVGWLPEGFQEVDTLQHQIPSFGGAVTHLVLSNGDAVFSVFIEKNATEGVSQRKMKGEKQPVNLYSHSKLGHRITVLGEVSMEVVRKVALSVEARSG